VGIAIGSRKEVAVINVTPMIDVLLVLLIVFMLLPSHTHGLKSDLPQPAPDNATALPDPQQVVVQIAGDGSIAINSQPVARDQLEARLQSLFAVRPDGVLFVDGSRELEFADVATVIDTARGAGVNRIGLLTAKR
jgi:biopolymer transport protein ExbD